MEDAKLSYPPEQRYMNDPVFHALVHQMRRILEDNAMRQWTPTELREAVILAACDYEMRHVRPLFGRYQVATKKHAKVPTIKTIVIAIITIVVIMFISQYINMLNTIR